MLDEIHSIGFTKIELSHGIRLSLIDGIERAIEQDPKLKVTSLHNFCPLPTGYLHSAPNIYLLSSENESERGKAIRHTIQTMDFAVKMRTQFVVLHLGRVPMTDYTSQLLVMIHERKHGTEKYQRLLESAIAKRKSKGRKPFLRVMKSLETLVEAATERSLVLCVESRYQLEEIPAEHELAEIFRIFDATQVGYWHDTGHVQTWHNLGLTDHLQWLRQFQVRLAGCHLHDVVYPDWDHQIPGDGMVPFDQLMALRRPDVLKVFEFEPGTPAAALKERLPQFMTNFETIEWKVYT